ncbi:hypothetical protein E5134_10820 [Pasteurella multocida]|uniref:hypothetical protein n=1 Tax=Pasteurella multocida TaxID=747 RepID=UPI0007F88FF8|nr:hypothetical protein [Pasteurella multocida]MDY4593638.1 hypothetical protein [[Pasteurella] aerogenes]OBP21251.1 hypothetical protein A0R64_08130 [Pasteurella multocida subsp. multocida]QCA34464.1 hypothetical protein E5134_10820 [Pasteurella multocida]UWZ95033.1 hypothetical protein A0R66_009315 [Pasteurella multocida subsp. multocida]HDX0980436.1 hypothetical protein [Pasteurella multocida]
MDKEKQTKLPLTHALAFATHLINYQYEGFDPNKMLRSDIVSALFDYAELIQKEYERRIDNQAN